MNKFFLFLSTVDFFFWLQPERLLSPETVMRTQCGSCFEMSTLLVSLLIGSGYDAYVVSGYATQEFCSNDLTRTNCPLINEPPPVILHF